MIRIARQFRIPGGPSFRPGIFRRGAWRSAVFSGSLAVGTLALFAPCFRVAAAGGTPETLSAEQFLAIARRPLLDDAWVRAAGEIQARLANGKRRRADLALDARFLPDSFRGELLVNGRALCRILQDFSPGAGKGRRETGLAAAGPGLEALKAFGILPEDVSLSFLYWDLVRELPRDSVRGQSCRVFVLRRPDGKRWVHLWLHAHYVFPMRVLWFDQLNDGPARTLEFKDFKRRGELWFLRELVLIGKDWKTRVVLRRIDLARTTDRPPPANLFRALERHAEAKTGKE